MSEHRDGGNFTADIPEEQQREWGGGEQRQSPARCPGCGDYWRNLPKHMRHCDELPADDGDYGHSQPTPDV